MSRKIVGNWVDRFDPLEPTVCRVLGHALGLDQTDVRLVEHALTIRGLVEADATEVHVARHVRSLFPIFDVPEPDAPTRRLIGIALWHATKVGLVRDRAERRARELMSQIPARSWSDQVRESLLREPVESPAPESAYKPLPHEVERQREGDDE